MEGLTLRPYHPDDAAWIAQRHGELYQQYEGFDASFQPVVRRALQDFAPEQASDGMAGWVAMRAGQPVGCIFCAPVSSEAARIRMFLLEPSERGEGHGRKMLVHAMQFARKSGFRFMKISTYAEHQAACRLYARMGFEQTSARPVQAYGRDLTEVVWQMQLETAVSD